MLRLIRRRLVASLCVVLWGGGVPPVPLNVSVEFLFSVLVARVVRRGGSVPSVLDRGHLYLLCIYIWPFSVVGPVLVYRDSADARWEPALYVPRSLFSPAHYDMSGVYLARAICSRFSAESAPRPFEA